MTQKVTSTIRFKIEMAKQGVVRALTLASQGTTEGMQA